MWHKRLSSTESGIIGPAQRACCQGSSLTILMSCAEMYLNEFGKSAALVAFSRGVTMSDYEHILPLILDLGTHMVRSGAETHRVEDSLYRLLDSYGFTACNVWVIPSNIQVTVTAPDGMCLTQIRHIRQSGIDFSRLDDLNNLSRLACSEKMTPCAFSTKLEEIVNHPHPAIWVQYLAGALAGGGFGVFFNCDLSDAAAAVFASLLVTFLSRKMGKNGHNPLISNLIIAFLAETFIIVAVQYGLGHHPGYVTAGVVMLLISALGTTNGVRDLISLDTLSGVMNISLSFIGAIGIAMGIVLSLRLFLPKAVDDITILNPDVGLELLACTVGCVGFSLWFQVKKHHILWCALGAFLTWSAYSLCFLYVTNNFWATLVGSVVCAFFSQIMARSNKAPATIFQTISVFPMIPGAALYHCMYGFVIGDLQVAYENGSSLLLSCFGIVLGFLLIQVISPFIWPTVTGKNKRY